MGPGESGDPVSQLFVSFRSHHLDVAPLYAQGGGGLVMPASSGCSNKAIDGGA